MKVTEELISAYIDGNVSEEERRQVREYLAQHSVERDLAFSLIEGTNTLDECSQEPDAGSMSVIHGRLFSEIACCAAAFVPEVKTRSPKPKVRNNIGQRIKRILSFLNELDQED